MRFQIVAVPLMVTYLICSCLCDIYMHNPRGSNNRLDEDGRERNNANRLFDSQNNNRGGYNVGSLYYYNGSVLPVEWTSQHSCGDANNHCELILQYMCGPNVRDGATTTTIPDNIAQCENYDCNTDLRFGMNENYNYYLNCKTRERNKGLFTADQKLKGETAQYTRQNPGGTRRGYECPEERDYYPYWHPTPWRDIAIMTNDVSRCKYYQMESENVKSRFHCKIPYMTMMANRNRRDFVLPNNQEDCESWTWEDADGNEVQAEWVEVNSHGIPAPKCQETEFSRDNHLGNGLSGYPNLFNWTIPVDAVGDNCAMRIRYNISTEEFDGWDGSTNASLNAPNRNDGSLVDLATKYGLADQETAEDRGYVLENNPQLQIFNSEKLVLQLAVNTAQFGRTFQDRSHTYAVRQAPAELNDVMIHNVNVRGKRGNIVQVYPAVEYDFVPNTLQASVGDYVHMQWTGSNTNPRNNDGQGLAGTDRSNMVMQADRAYQEDSGQYWQGTDKYGHWGRSYPAQLSAATMLGLGEGDREKLAVLSPGQFRGELSELDDAGTYFDLGPRNITRSGTVHYMCTRNNNFSNRSQKGRIVVVDYAAMSAQIGATGGSITMPSGRVSVSVGENVLDELTYMTLEEWPEEAGDQLVKDAGSSIDFGAKYASNFVAITPEKRLAAEGMTFEVSMKLHDDARQGVTVYRSVSSNFAAWQEVDTEVEDGYAKLNVAEGGVFVARAKGNAGAIAGAVIGVVVAVAIVIAVVVYCRKHPEKAESVSRTFRNMKRGTQRDV